MVARKVSLAEKGNRLVPETSSSPGRIAPSLTLIVKLNLTGRDYVIGATGISRGTGQPAILPMPILIALSRDFIPLLSCSFLFAASFDGRDDSQCTQTA